MMSMRNILALPLFTALVFAQQPIEVVRVISQTVDRKIPLPGEFVPYETAAIHAKVTGFVDEVKVDRGSAVSTGQTLATLVAPELKAKKADAEARARAAEAQHAEAAAKWVAAESIYDRLKKAAETPGVVAGNELLQAEKAAEGARAQVQATEDSVKASRVAVDAWKDMEDYLEVRAPFPGIITSRNVHPGALVGPGAGASNPAMFHLEQDTRLRLVVLVPEVDVSGIPMGQRVTFTVPAYLNRKFSGVIARAARSMDRKTRSMAVELDVTNPAGLLAPGMYPTVMWPLRRSRPSLLVPASSVVTTADGAFVIRVRNSIAHWIPVRRGAVLPSASGDQVEVYGSLSAGDLVVLRGRDEPREGSSVSVSMPSSEKTS
ncbi:MAG: efflux RND transporter periplasmic adaptor subunit [Acidobacteria bacterium]|nr:efflux RND transporter periplasmic adaptor subunit [Acidobacteriota bacterium]